MKLHTLTLGANLFCSCMGNPSLKTIYMFIHITWLVSNMDPIKYIFEKPTLTGRISHWQVLLLEYDIEYLTQKAVKGSALADYLAH